MKNGAIPVLLLLLVAVISSCRAGNNNPEQQTNNPDSDLNGHAAMQKSDKILIAYFSHTGNTRAVAEKIHAVVGGDIFEIRTVDPYPPEYRKTVDRAWRELNGDQRPELTDSLTSIKDYGIVFLGYPNWCGTLPMAVWSFLEQHDFSGKTIAPFCTHGGGGLAHSLDDINKLCPSSNLSAAFAINGNRAHQADKEISAWLNEIGITH